MQHEEQINYLFNQHFKEKIENTTQLAPAGSDRIYFRIQSKNHSAIACYGNDVKENQTFIHHANNFKSKQLAVPSVFSYTEDYLYYLQEDLGSESLYDKIKKDGISVEVENLYKKTLVNLIQLQVKGAENFDFERCYPIKEFNKSSMFWDLNSFKYYFVRMAKIHFNENELNKDFHTICNYLLEEKNLYFMIRDCQSRNIFIKDEKPYFIDFQGGRRGALQYDVASLLWQAGARIPMEIRNDLLDYYIAEISSYIKINKADFKEKYYGFVLIRMLQVLGAYGFRGLIEKRPHFLDSIIPALENVKWFLENIDLKLEINELRKVLNLLVISDLFKDKKNSQNNKHNLKIEINSFSYKRGIPVEKFGNGGGFVFDCRGILNPGRFEPYKILHGKDKEVIDFLENKTKVIEFLEHIWKTIDINIEDYLERNFEHLQINFGCTGGQHRSVYCAEQTKRYLEKKYNVKIEINHIEREINGQFI
jgi:aminoglycoside/choline kinase family phosphotransferase